MLQAGDLRSHTYFNIYGPGNHGQQPARYRFWLAATPIYLSNPSRQLMKESTENCGVAHVFGQHNNLDGSYNVGTDVFSREKPPSLKRKTTLCSVREAAVAG